MFSRFSTVFAKEISTKSVLPKTCLNVINKQSMSSFIVPRNIFLKSSQISKIRPVNRSIFSIVNKVKCDKSLVSGQKLSCFNVISRGFGCGLKTKKAAAKRFIKTGKGDLKYGKANKRHLTSHMTKTRQRRLNQLGTLKGVWAKKMKKLLCD
mmetsp:Transcript_3107/g.3250  ORF Transcript_3107/g.3250 Transcript_3107/m.3250 type:complete len:152 (-) Transcript_3107:138-593(-)